MFGFDLVMYRWCTIGGMIGNNSCGVHSQLAGCTADNVEALDILLYDGTRMRAGKTGDVELSAIEHEDKQHNEIYSKLKNLRDHYRQLVHQRYPKIPRRISDNNLE